MQRVEKDPYRIIKIHFICWVQALQKGIFHPTQLHFGLSPTLILTRDLQGKTWRTGSTVIQFCCELEPHNLIDVNSLN